MGKALRAGVIGAGVFGGYHAEKLAGFPGVTLVGVYDHHPAHAEALTARVGGAVFESEAELIGAVDFVTVATPAIAHARSTLAALAAGKAVAACGFLERAGLAAMGLFELPERPRLLEAVRTSAPSPRNLDVSVVLDLMIHDLDLALALSEADPMAIEADGAAVTNALLDHVEAEADFEDGFTARFRASRIAEVRERTMRVVYPSGEVRVDFLAHTFENTTPFRLDPDFEESAAYKDRLAASLAAFIGAVRGERAAPLASVADGARALDLALAVEHAMARQGLV